MKYRKKWLPFSTAAIVILSTLSNAQAQTLKLLRTTELNSYPSASATEWYRGRLYLMGDDAPELLILRKNHRKEHSIPVFPGNEKRIHYSVKPDIEAAAIFRVNGQTTLLLHPSFSGANRNKIGIVSLNEKTWSHPKVVTTTKPDRSDLQEINIEGATQFQEKLLLANRGNLSAPQNYLLLADFDTLKGIANWQKPIPLQMPATVHFAGVSGLYYVAGKDVLLLTASTEITTSATADGEIGDSYLGIVYNLKQQLQNSKVVADTLINLTPVLRSKTPQQIGSVAVESVKGNKYKIHLVSDNDNGASTIFRLRLKMPVQ